ncbi:MAG: hypothetical protein Q8Q44_04480, partial [Nocardioides sp.]|nr:hypothetical protein [Nocardioides sp.]
HAFLNQRPGVARLPQPAARGDPGLVSRRLLRNLLNQRLAQCALLIQRLAQCNLLNQRASGGHDSPRLRRCGC